MTNPEFLISLLFIPIAYLLGSISTAVIVCRLCNLPDPRTAGSNNPGATNVMRIGGKKPAALTLLGDALKGFIPVFIVSLLAFNPAIIAATAVAAFLGHLFPIFFGFKGGKGVATALGAILALHFGVAITALMVWVITFIITRISSLSALVAACSAPLILALPYFWKTPFIIKLYNAPFDYIIAIIIIDILLVIRHKSNIERLLSGAEKKL